MKVAKNKGNVEKIHSGICFSEHNTVERKNLKKEGEKIK